MGTLTYPNTLVAGENEDVNELNANLDAIKTVINGNIDTSNLSASAGVLVSQLATNDLSATRRGKSIVATEQTTTSTTYTSLTTPDEVTVTLPTDGLIVVTFQALWKDTVVSNGRAAIFLGANQIKNQSATAPTVQEHTSNSTANTYVPLYSTGAGLTGFNGGTAHGSDVTTGQLVGSLDDKDAGPATIFAAAGTYAVGIKYRNVAAGTLSVKERKLWVWTLAF